MTSSLYKLQSSEPHRLPMLEEDDQILDDFAAALSDRIFSVVMEQLPGRLKSPFTSSIMRFEWDLNLTWEKGAKTLQMLIPEFENWEPFYEWSQIYPEFNPLDQRLDPIIEVMDRVCDKIQGKLVPMFELFQKNNPVIECLVLSPNFHSGLTYSAFIPSGTICIDLRQKKLPKEAIHSPEGAIAVFLAQQKSLRLQERVQAIGAIALTLLLGGLILALRCDANV